MLPHISHLNARQYISRSTRNATFSAQVFEQENGE